MSDITRLPSGGVFFGPLRRTLALLLTGAIIIALSCLAEFRTLNWVYDPKATSMHLLSCPKLVPSMNRNEFVGQGRYCEVQAYGWDVEVRSRLNDAGFVEPEYSCSVPRFDMIGDNWDEFADFRLKNPIVCKVQSPCSQVQQCSESVGGAEVIVPCPRGPEEALNAPNQQTARLWAVLRTDGTPAGTVAFQTRWVNYRNTIFTEFCDSDLKLPVAKIIALRGMIGGLAWLVLIWLITDIGLHAAYHKYKKDVARKQNIDLSRVERNFNDNLYAHVWGRFTPPPLTSRTVSLTTPRAGNLTPSTRDGMVSRLVTASPMARGTVTPRSAGGSAAATPRSFKVAVCQDPTLAFVSRNWRNKVNSFLHQRSLRQRGKTKDLVVRMLFYPFFVILFGSLLAWAYLAVSPRNLVHIHSIADSLFDDYSTVFKAFSTWIILPFLLLDELTDLLTFFCISAVTRFSKPSVFAKFRKENEAEDVDQEDDDHTLSDISSLSSIHSVKVVEDDLVPESVIAVVCVDTYHLTDEAKLVENIQSVIDVVGIERLFVLHFSDELSPPDDTVTLLQARIHPAIQYIYVPERDKLAAVYWFSKYYLPLFQLHQPADETCSISHILVSDQAVWIPSSLTIPHSLLETEENSTQKTGLVCFGPSFKQSNRFLDVDLKFDMVEAIFQSDRASMGDGEVGGAILTLWDRESLEVAMFDHKPLTESFGGDFPGSGINVVRQEGRKIKFVSNALIKVNGSNVNVDCYDGLFTAARRKRLIFTDFTSLFSPRSLFNLNRLSSKPSNLVRLLRFIWDTIRVPVLLSTALRDPLGLGFVLVIFMMLEWIKVTVLSTALIPSVSRKERPSFVTSLLYPLVFVFYDLLILRPASMVAALLWAISDRPGQSIHEREDYEKDIPPCLPFPDAPWFSAWQKLPDEFDQTPASRYR